MRPARCLLAIIFEIDRFDSTTNGIDMFQNLLVFRVCAVPFDRLEVIERRHEGKVERPFGPDEVAAEFVRSNFRDQSRQCAESGLQLPYIRFRYLGLELEKYYMSNHLFHSRKKVSLMSLTRKKPAVNTAPAHVTAPHTKTVVETGAAICMPPKWLKTQFQS